jgi:Zn-dependent protease with chaperone function
MSKFFQILFAVIYILLTILSFLLVLEVSGVRMHYSRQVEIIFGWVIFCFLSVFYRTPIELFLRYQLRRPVGREAARLERCFAEVSAAAGYRGKIRLRVDEGGGVNAFAIGHNIIAVSPGLLGVLNDDELKGVLAHELGHLMSGDCIVGSAFVTAGELPKAVAWLYSKVLLVISAGLRLSGFIARRIDGLLGLGVLVVMGYGLYRWHLIKPMVAVFLFLVLFALLGKLFRVLTLLISRYTEYKQDAFAVSLGYGKELGGALSKLAQGQRQRANPYFILMNGTHPLIHNRIRKLEKAA